MRRQQMIAQPRMRKAWWMSAALDQGVAVRRGQGYTLRVTAVPAVHRRLLALCQPLDGGQGDPGSPDE
jgi:hypothetical protein